jgi:hypothetical protein
MAVLQAQVITCKKIFPVNLIRLYPPAIDDYFLTMTKVNVY